MTASTQGVFTGLRWPTPGAFDQLSHVTAHTITGPDPRTLPRLGARATDGLWLGVRVKDSAGSRIIPLDDAVLVTRQAGYLSDTSRIAHWRAENDLLVLEQQALVMPDRDVLIIRLTVTPRVEFAEADAVLLMHPAPNATAIPAFPVADWVQDDATLEAPNHFAAIHDEGAEALVTVAPFPSLRAEALRRLLALKDTAGGRLDYSYYANNRLKDVVSANPDGVNVGYRYDELNRLESVDDTSTGLPTRTTGYTYNANGSLETMTAPNAVVHTYGYDPLNRLRTLTIAKGPASLHAYEYKLRASGHRRQIVEGVKTTTFSYDGVYRLNDETVAADANGNDGSIGYTLDKVGNRLARNSQLSALNSQLNQSFNSRDWLNGDAYTANGSTQVGRTVLGEPPATDIYDFEEHLILRTKPDGTTINVNYDADGHRVAKNILNASAAPVSSTSWLVDTNNLTGYAQVLEERSQITNPASQIRKVYTYGSALISQATSLNSQPSTLSYYTSDGHGNVRELTDASGTVTDRYDYDAFGLLVFQSGTTANAYRYCGEQIDGDLGLYYLRARYLNPDSGRFWSMDSYEGSRSDPMSLHKYLYAHADPVGMIDPSGHFSMVEVQQAVFVTGTLARIALPNVARFSITLTQRIAASILRPFFAMVGAIPLATQAGQKLSSWDKFRRLFINPTQTYPGVSNWLKDLLRTNWCDDESTPRFHSASVVSHGQSKSVVSR